MFEVRNIANGMDMKIKKRRGKKNRQKNGFALIDGQQLKKT
jgi:hypothetical protein